MSVINKKINTDTRIEVTPNATIGEIQSRCVGTPTIEECCEKRGECTYVVEQLVDVKFPLTLSAKVNTPKCSVHCGSRCRNNSNRMKRCCILLLAFCFGIRFSG